MAVKENLVRKLCELEAELRGDYVELSGIQAQAYAARATAYEASSTSTDTITAIRFEMDFSDVEYRKEIVTLQGDIQAKESYRDHIRFLLKYGLEYLEEEPELSNN